MRSTMSNAFGRTRTAVLAAFFLCLLIPACATERQEVSPESQSAADGGALAVLEKIDLSHVRHPTRYQDLFRYLLDKGITAEHLVKVFSSRKAAQKDDAAVSLISARSTRIARPKTTAELMAIARRITAHLKLNASYYNRLEHRYGVNREIAAAILFKETDLGAFDNWRHDAFIALNNIIAYAVPPVDGDVRGSRRIARIIDVSQQSLASLLLYGIRHNIDITVTDFPSSYAGAIGLPQFLPLYLDYAVSAGDARPDLYLTGDAILSIGSLLQQRFGWPGPVELSKLADIDRIVSAYTQFDRVTDDASFCMAQDLDDYPLNPFTDVMEQTPERDYFGRYCKILMQYNFSSYYVLDVMQIAFHAHRLIK